MGFAQAAVLYNPQAPPLTAGVSANGRYLVDQYGSPYLVNGDTPWKLAFAANPTDQATYLADRASFGCNTVMTDLIGNDQMFGNTNGANWNGDLPGTFGTNSFTPNSAYWAKIDAFFQLCASYGITVWAMPLDAYATVGTNFFATITSGQATAFGTFLGNRYKTFPGIVWMIGNDYDGDGPTGGAQNANPSTAIYNALIAAVKAAGDTHLWTSELAYYEADSSDGAATGGNMDINGCYTYHPTYEAILRGRAAVAKPAVMIEAVYDQATTSYPDTNLDMRKVCLWPMTCGAAGQFYGNDLWWPMPSGWLSDLDTAVWQQRARMMAVFKAVEWWNLQPDTGNALVTAGRQTQWPNSSGPAAGSFTPHTDDSTYGKYVTAAYTPDGTLAVIYNPSLAGVTAPTLTLSAAPLGASPQITRIDPASGAQTNIGWTTSLASPGNNSAGDPDWLYLIEAA